MSMIPVVFTAEEWLEALNRGMPIGDCPITPDRLTPEMLICAVMNPDLEPGSVAAAWPLWNATHLDGLWVEAGCRGNPAVLRPLLELVSATLAANQVHTTYALIAEDDTAGQEMASRLGFARVPGLLYKQETPP